MEKRKCCTYREAGRSGPDARSLGIEDGGFIDVACSYKTGLWMSEGAGGFQALTGTWYQRTLRVVKVSQ